MKLEDLPDEGEETVVEAGREPPDFFEEDEEDEADEADGFFAGAEEGASSLAPQVSVVLSSTSWADRDTAGFRALSPGSSMAVSSYGLMRSSISPEPAKRAGEAQMDAAIVKRKYFIVKTPF